MNNRTIYFLLATFNGGGAERITINFAKQFNLIGLNVEFVALEAIGEFLQEVKDSKIKHINLKSKKMVFGFFPILRWLKNISRNDIVISTTRSTSILLGLAKYFYQYRLKVIIIEPNLLNEIENMPFLKKVAYKFLMKTGYNNSDFIIANSNDTLKDLIEKGIINEFTKTTVIGNPVIWLNDRNEKEFGVAHKWLDDDKYKCIITAGRLVEQKNHVLMLKSFAEVVKNEPNYRLIILGQGPLKVQLQKLCVDLNIDNRVDFLGFVENPRSFFKKADLFLLTSRWEGFGNVLIEALAEGLPLLSTNCPGGPKEIIGNNRYGILINEWNSETIAVTILNTDWRSKFPIQMQIERANNYSIEEISSKYLSIINEIK